MRVYRDSVAPCLLSWHSCRFRLSAWLNYCQDPPKPSKLLARLRISTSSAPKTQRRLETSSQSVATHLAHSRMPRAIRDRGNSRVNARPRLDHRPDRSLDPRQRPPIHLRDSRNGNALLRLSRRSGTSVGVNNAEDEKVAICEASSGREESVGQRGTKRDRGGDDGRSEITATARRPHGR